MIYTRIGGLVYDQLSDEARKNTSRENVEHTLRALWTVVVDHGDACDTEGLPMDPEFLAAHNYKEGQYWMQVAAHYMDKVWKSPGL